MFLRILPDVVPQLSDECSSVIAHCNYGDQGAEWAQVTAMSSGADSGPAAGEETTVEDLLRAVRHMPPEGNVIPVVERGLHYLDSRALAALLKELNKVPKTPNPSLPAAPCDCLI